MKSKINGNNTQLQLLQLSSDPASSIKQKLNNAQVFIPSRLKPFPIGNRIGLSISGSIFRKCECGHRWVKENRGGSLILWTCENCSATRLIEREKADIELISELLNHPDLKGWDGTFLREMQRCGGVLGKKQKEKLRSIAQKLGVKISRACEISEAEGGEA